MLSEHTPLPWELRGPSPGHMRGFDDGGDYAVAAAGQIIAEFIHQTDRHIYQPAEANARLFMAAPALLAACRAYIHSVRVDNSPGKQHAAMKLIEAAAAKAEGR